MWKESSALNVSLVTTLSQRTVVLHATALIVPPTVSSVLGPASSHHKSCVTVPTLTLEARARSAWAGSSSRTQVESVRRVSVTVEQSSVQQALESVW